MKLKRFGRLRGDKPRRLLMGIHPVPTIFTLVGVYVCCGAMRLAGYNVEADTGHRDFFFGMPSPGAAGCVASLALLIINPNAPHATANQFGLPLTEWRQAAFMPVLLALPI